MDSSETFSRRVRVQGGVISVQQAQALGVRRNTLHRLVERGWSRPFPGVYAEPEATDFPTLLRAALLWCGDRAVVSHRAAGFLLELDGVPPEIDLTVPIDQRVRSSGRALIHRSNVPDEDLHLLRGLPATALERTLVDLASCLSSVQLAMAVESAWLRGWVDPPSLENRLELLEMRGRRGASDLSRVVADCLGRKRPLDSALEVKFWWLVRQSALPRPVPGWDLPDDEAQPMRLDFAYPAQRLAIETDGHWVHSGRASFERDAERLSRIAAAKWRVMHVTWKQLDEPHRVFERIFRALASGRMVEAG